MAEIAQQSGDSATSRVYRKSAQQSYASYAGSQYELEKFEYLIQAVVAEVPSAQISPELEEALQLIVDNGSELVGAIRQVLAGVRDEDDLYADMDYLQSLIIVEILKRISAES